MKKIHIALLVLIAGAIAVLLTFLKGASTYDTIDTAIAKPGKKMRPRLLRMIGCAAHE